MKWLIALLLSVLPVAAQLPPQMAYFKQSPAAAGGGSGCDSLNDASLMAYWRLDEASGNREDTKGANDLADNNTVTAATGRIGDAGDFERDNVEYLSIADNAELSSGDIDFSVWLWVKPETVVDQQLLLSKESEYNLQLEVAGDVQLSFHVGVSFVGVTNSTVVSAGSWYLVVGVHNAAANTISISVNGNTFETRSSVSGPADTANTFYIGRYSAVTALAADGLIDECGFTKRLITQEEVTALYAAGAGCRPTGL